MHVNWWANDHYGYLISHYKSHIARIDEQANFVEDLEFSIMGSKLELIGSCNGLDSLRECIDHKKHIHGTPL